MDATGIAIGADVLGTDGKLGEVHRLIVDARSNSVTDLVVKHGFLFGNERVVPLGCVTSVEGGMVRLNVDEDGFARFNGYADDRYHAPDPDYSGPPGFSNEAFLLDMTVARGGQGFGNSEPPLGFPGGEQTSPDDIERPVIQAGSDVLDADAEKVGEVGEYSLDPDSGNLLRLTVKRGFLFKNETELPLAWVDQITDKGVILTVRKANVEALAAGEHRS